MVHAKGQPFFVGILVTVLVLTACTPTATPATPTTSPTAAATQAPTKGGTLVVGRSADSLNLDPSDSPNIESILVAGVISDSLLRFKPGTYEVEPWLATSWTSTPDGITWRFQLRQNVRFHDGTPFNAEAVAFTFMRYLDPNSEFKALGQWGLATASFSNIGSVTALDQYTVEMKMKTAFAPILSALAGPLSGIVSPTAYKANPQGFRRQPVGTGAFRFVEWRTDDRIVLARFDDYWAGPAYLDQVIFRVVPENTARVLALRQREIQIMTSPDPTSIDVVQRDPALDIQTIPGLQHVYLAPNHTRAPFNNVKVREAVYSAINRDALVKAFIPGGAVAKGVMQTAFLGFDGTIEWPKYDPARARQLLAEAGYANGFSAGLLLGASPFPYMPQPKEASEAIQADLAAVGIRVQIQMLETAALLQKLRNADFDLSLNGFSPVIPDSWTIMFTQFDSRRAILGSANNFHFYKNPEVDALNDVGTSASDPAERVRAYKKIQQILRRDVARIDIADVDAMYGVRSEVRDFVPAPLTFYLNKTWLGTR